MKVLMLDMYRSGRARVSKDTNGGYGTVNDYGDGFIARLLTRLKARSVEWPPLSGVYAAGVLRSSGHEVTYRKAVLGEVSPALADGNDLCLLTSSVVCHETEIESIRRLRSSVPIGVIGPFATAVPRPYLDAGAFVISGEPEIYLRRASSLDHLLSANGVVTPSPYKGEGIRRDGDLPIDAELDDLPFPAWDLVSETSAPRYGLIGGESGAFLPLIATRGCPYSCSHYCVYPLQQGKQPRLRSARSIAEEMCHWQDTRGVSLFMFRDPVFSLVRKHTLKLCDEITGSGRRFQFVVETHLNNLDEELSRRLKQAGLVMVKTGIECPDEDILKSAKRFSVARRTQLERIRLLESLGIKVTCFYMFGFPNDTVASCQRTIDYAQELNTYGAQFSVFTPYPGTPAYLEYQASLVTKTYEDFTQWHLVFKHEHMNAEQIRALLGQAYRRYYTNPRWIAKVLKDQTRPAHG
ncbi:MAG TPA: radical SAM protein [Candidatus Methylomirabilis sp.]|nr:radical SAM protein [Candidatus Methylomirabilis sp.]